MEPSEILLTSRIVYPVTSPPLRNGWIHIQAGEIVGFGDDANKPDLAAAQHIDLGESVLLPGLINAHCHLDYTAFRNAVPRTNSFTRWIENLNALKRSFSDENLIASIHAGFKEAAHFGTTTLVNIESFPDLIPTFLPPPIRTIWCVEMIDIRRQPGLTGFEMFLRQREMFEPGGVGISPHAPYTVSPALYRETARVAREHNILLTTHVAESREEREMFLDGSGALYKMLAALGRDMSDCGEESPLAVLADNGLDSDWLLAHLNEISDGDLDILRRIRPAVVHCPRSHEFFGHSDFPYLDLKDVGCKVVLGTDSLASNRDLSLFHEMAAFSRKHPLIDPADIIRMTTSTAADVIGYGGRLGTIQDGAIADLISLPITLPCESVAAFLVAHRGAVSWRMMGGIVQTQ